MSTSTKPTRTLHRLPQLTAVPAPRSPLTDAEVTELTAPGAWMSLADICAMTGYGRKAVTTWRTAAPASGHRMPEPRCSPGGARLRWSRRDIAEWWTSLPSAA